MKHLERLEAITGLALPDTALVAAAIDHAEQHSPVWLFHHVMRSWAFAAMLAKEDGIAHDAEVLAIASVLHDLGLHPGAVTDRRFEVAGADAARAFLADNGDGVDARRAQLVWDAIALHSTGSIARYKEAEVALTQAGIAADYGGMRLDAIGETRLAALLEAHPRTEMKRAFTSCLCVLATEHPATTYGTWVADFGKRFVPGYAPPSSVDALHAAPYAE